ncbi:MAG: helix-hairpin-helix domain-containing protein [Desulfobulbaceae bacterium]|jgi:competence ComEA-like helix-hairpin-helix protein|nr:helix-hairpin-helix domain-containing protein [Desulfobulbaceae bacterium]
MTDHQQRAIIIIVILGFIILAAQEKPISWHHSPVPIQTAELRQNIADHPLLYLQTININTATAQELTGIPRIGPVLAQKITAYRTQHGPFQKLADLGQVWGIGAKTVEHLRQYCHIDDTE